MRSMLIAAYVLGLLVTAVALLPSQKVRHSFVVNAAAILLWPLYWGQFLVFVLMDRSRR